MRTVITESDRLKAIEKISQQVGNHMMYYTYKRVNSNVKDISGVKGAVSYTVPTPDDYKSRTLKYIPSEVVVLYLTLDGMISSASVESSLKIRLLWLVFLILFFGTWIYLWRVEKVTKKLNWLFQQ